MCPWPRDGCPVTLGRMKPYSVVLKEGHPYGVLVGVSLPGSPEPVPTDVLARMHPEEREVAEGLKGFRQPEWVGGRLAVNGAMRLLGMKASPILSDPRGAPVPPPGVSLSISHKRDLVVALAARKEAGDIGVDLEDQEPERLNLAPRLLTAAELASVQELPPHRQWTAVLLRFSLKEALYKAVAPRLMRFIDFDEAEVDLQPDGTANLRLQTAAGEPSPRLEGRYTWMDRRVLTTVRARWS